ncbi:DUF192 domain-containing protein [Candidatus Saccharibacteria bacterium]|nr:DUF192 domain-containing protein [Candidatus Saccharibacteria bacterium]MBH2007486.1 DUF192 domain-containing protein [Candidatus Saccharibacteria bacterium]
MEYGARSHAEHSLVWIGIVATILLSIGFVAYTFWPSTMGATNVSIGAKTFQAAVADTNEKRALGLTDLKVLPENQALLVVYDREEVWPIQTKGLAFPIDVVWLSANKKVAYVAKDAKPSTTATYTPGGKSRYVLQLPAGSIVRHNITVGKSVKFDYGG